MADYETIAQGAVSMPLPGAIDPTKSLLRYADPGLFHALGLLAHAIEKAVGPRLVAEAARVAPDLGITSAVAHTLAEDPAPLLQTEQLGFPLLALYRKGGPIAWRTMSRRVSQCKVELLWALPPMPAGERNALASARALVSKVVDARSVLGMEPTYAPPGIDPDTGVAYVAGFHVWRVAGITKLDWSEDVYGDAPWSGELYMPALLMTGTLVERTRDPDDGLEFEGLDLAIDPDDPVGDVDNDDLIEAQTDTP